MLFNSPEYFFVFLPIAVVVYYLLCRLGMSRMAKVWLVGSSLYFYAYWNTVYIFLILSSIVVNYSIAGLLHRAKEEGAKIPFSPRAILIVGLVFNLGLLGYFKYSDFFIENVNWVFDTEFDLLHLLLPLAISFFTFQQIAYLVDCYRYDVHDYDFLSYCLFVSFFPQLIAGPIVHHKEMMPQFTDPANEMLRWENLARGVLLFSIGLFKKVVIADTFAIWADAGYAQTDAPGLFAAWQTSLAYTFQLYYDFSGYTDMAIGAALMFNIHLPLNFNSPYKALNIQDFWRRWHMTLSRWLRDYLYISLGGNRRGSGRTYFNLFATFLLGGLWHGAGWTFVIWGAMHGSALMLHRLWSQTGRRMHAAPAWLLTFVFVNFAWVMFRAEDLASAKRIMTGMLGFNGFDLDASISGNLAAYMGMLQGQEPVLVQTLLGPVGAWLFVVVFALIAFLSRNSIEIVMNKHRYTVIDTFRVGFSFSLVLLLAIASTSSVFLYFNF